MISYPELVELVQEPDPLERVRRSSHAFLSTTEFTGLAITFGGVEAGTHRLLYSHGYGPEAESHLLDSFIASDPLYQHAASSTEILTWRQGDFATGFAAQTWLRPAGYRNGFSLAIQHPKFGEIGSVHANCTEPDVGDRQLDEANALASYLASTLALYRAQLEVRLTSRERHVVRLIVEGASNPEIAAQMHIARRTVATHIENILRKFGTHSRVGIAVEATRIGLT